jgi:hypothetical protein
MGEWLQMESQLFLILQILFTIYAFIAAYLHGSVRDALYPSNKPLSWCGMGREG